MGQLSHPHPEVLAAAAAAPCRQPRQLWALGRSHSPGDPRGLSDVVKAAVPLPGPGSLWGLCSGLGESHPLSAAAVAAAAVDWSPAAAANGRRKVLHSRPQGAGGVGSGSLRIHSETGSGKLLDRSWTVAGGRPSPALTALPS